MWLGRWIATWGLCGLSMVVALLGGELMVRYLAPQKLYRFPQGMFETHPSLQYRLVPGFVGVSKTVEFKTHIRTNSLGLRAEREYGRKDAATFRLLLLGDSFTMGVGVEQHETYSQVLERRLADGHQSLAPSYEVINAGVPGYNTQQALTYLRESGFALEPDLVVLGFYLGNDIAENFAMPSISVQDGYLQEGRVSDGVLPTSVRRYLALNSYLYHLLWPYRRRLVDRSLWVRTEQERLRRRLSIYMPESSVSPPHDHDIESLWDATQRYVAAMAEVTRKRGVPLAVVVIPEWVQVAPQQWQSLIQPMVSSGATYRINWPNQRMVALCRQLNLPFLDLLPVLAQAPPGEPLYIKLDGHWTRRGHEVASSAIEAFLRRQQLIPVRG